MTENTIRKILYDSFKAANVVFFQSEKYKAILLSDGKDLKLDQLDMDSLAAMEFCISVELNSGVSVVPEELSNVKTLKKLIKLITKRLK